MKWKNAQSAVLKMLSFLSIMKINGRLDGNAENAAHLGTKMETSNKADYDMFKTKLDNMDKEILKLLKDRHLYISTTLSGAFLRNMTIDDMNWTMEKVRDAMHDLRVQRNALEDYSYAPDLLKKCQNDDV